MRLLFFLFLTSFFCGSTLSAALPFSKENIIGNSSFSSHLPITEDFRKARETAHVFAKPLALVFVGSDWCEYSKKFMKEILYDPMFYQYLKNGVIFVKIDFPELNGQPPTELSQNYSLKEKHQIKNFPTIILLDPKQREITRLGYLNGGGKKYALHLKKILNKYAFLWNTVEEKKLSNLSEEELINMYSIADDLRCEHFRQQILEYGCQHAKGVYFLIEKYNFLVSRGEMQTVSAKKIRNEIIAKESENQSGALLRLAILDFQQMASGEAQDPITTIKPLLSYIKKSTNQDQDNAWRVYLMISQYLFDKKHYEKALHYSHHALECAKEEHKNEIEQMIKFIEENQV